MTYLLGQDKPSLESLQHFGVKGMKWGVRQRQVGGATDRILFGKRGVANIKEQVAQGKSVSSARWSQSGRTAVRGLLVVYGALVAKNLVQVGVTNAVLAKNTAKFAKAGRDAIPAITATAGKIPYSKLRRGAFVITTLK